MATAMNGPVGRGELDNRHADAAEKPVRIASTPDARGGCARYIGRVGALAVALGIGTAIATGHGLGLGVAYADEESSSDGTNTDTGTGEDPGAGTSAADTGITTTATATDSDPKAGTGPVTGPRSPRLRLGFVPDMVLNASGGARISRDDNKKSSRLPKLRDTADSGDPAVTSTALQSADKSTAARTKTLDNGGFSTATSIPTTVVERVRATLNAPTVRGQQEFKPLASVLRVKDLVNSVDQKTVARQQQPAAIAQAAVTVDPTPRDALAALPGQRLTVASRLVAAALAPLLTPGPASPQDPPALLGVLAWARREIQRTFFNQTPRAVADSVTTGEGTGVVVKVLDNDVDDDPKVVTTVTQGALGTVTTNGTTVTYTPIAAKTDYLAAGQSVEDSFTYTISDEGSARHLHGIFGFFSQGHTSTATVTVKITGVNDAPTAVNDVAGTVDEDAASTTINVVANDTDPDRTDTLTIATVGTAKYGTVSISTDKKTITYTPDARADALAAGQTGDEAFTYTISDGNGGTATGTVTLGVTGTNDVPTTVAGTLELDEDTTVNGFLPTGTDPDASVGSLTYEIVTGPANGTVAILGAATGAYIYTPGANYHGEDSFTYRVFDAAGASSTPPATISITVNSVNDDPVAPPATVNTEVGSTVSGNLSATDVDGDVLSYRVVGAPNDLVWSPTGSYSYSPTAAGRQALTYYVDDGNGGVTAGTLTLTATAPTLVVVVDTIDTDENGDPLFEDPVDVDVSIDGDWGVIRDAGKGTVTVIDADADGDDWDVRPGVDYEFDSVTDIAAGLDAAYVVSPAEGGSTLTVIDLSAEADAEQRKDISYDYEVRAVALDRRASREQGIDTIYTLDADGNLREVDAASGLERRSIRVVTSVSARASASAAAVSVSSKIAVAPGASKVYVVSKGRLSVVDTTRRLAARGSAADAEDQLSLAGSVAIDGDVTGLEVSEDGNTVYATVVRDGAAELVAYDAASLETTSARATRVSLGTASARAIAVSDAQKRAYVTTEGKTQVVDLDRLAVVKQLDTGAAVGVAVTRGGAVLLANPDAKAVSVVRVYDTSAVATADAAKTGTANSVNINVLANDQRPAGSGLSPTVVTQPTNGTATVNADGTIRYTPNDSWDGGTDTFSYTLTGGTSNPAPATVTVTVTPAVTVELRWGATPRDLDAHLTGPSVTGSGPRFEVSYLANTYNVDGSTTAGTAEQVAFLSGDDRDGAGPEVITINTRTPGDYLYYVDNFSGEAALAGTLAKVTVVNPDTGIATTYIVPTGTSTEKYWAVFKLSISDTGAVTITGINTLSDTVPTLLTVSDIGGTSGGNTTTV